MKIHIIHSLQALLIFSCTAHFVLQSPNSLGFNDGLEGTGPCGSFDIQSRANLNQYPVGGNPLHLLTTHNHVTYKIMAALLNDTSTWVDMIPPVDQTGVGDFCLPSVPGYAPWIGLDAVMQMVQFAPDGILYQCAAIVFVAGGPAPVDSKCKNSTDVRAALTAFTSTVPGHSATVGASPNTALSTSTPALSNATTTSTGTIKSTAATTSKAVSGATVDYKYRNIDGIWTLVAAILAACVV